MALEVRASVGMFGPALACVIVTLVRREGFANAGLHLPPRGVRRMWIAAYGIPFAAIAGATAISMLLGIQVWDRANGITAGWPVWKFASALAGVLTVVVALTMISTFGEELGWRGYLLPRLVPLGPIKASLIIGVAWGLWHAPLILLDGRGLGKGLELQGIVLFVALCVSWSIYMTWLRLRSGSIWPTVLSHAVLNVVTSTVFAVYEPQNLLWGSPIGVPVVACFAAVDVYLIASGKLK